MKAFLTGANGFIGAATTRRFLENGWEVAVLLRPGCDTARIADLLPRLHRIEGAMESVDSFAGQVKDFRPTAVVHHAWYAVPGQYPHALENLESLRQTLELVSKMPDLGCDRFYGIGTCFEYDFDRGWLHESSPANASTLYGACKNAACTALPKLGEKVGVRTAWLRPFYQYGPFEDTKRLVAAVITALLRGEPVDTTEGAQVRDFSHVSDVGSGIYACTAAHLEGIVNLGSGVPCTVRQITETIASKLGRIDLVNFGARPYNPTDPPFIVSNNSRIKTCTDWKPRFNLADGIQDTIDWWKSH